ncbi:MAG: RNA-binding transcriptional accessory protein [Christensenellaceae bacterium]|jgi:uncharacterized protein|nr:RNA-binding transcriptional accessory protein [Christensenellaceae bacterium]
MLSIEQTIAKEFDINELTVKATIALIDDGNTIPFIARYRKEVTGGINDEVLRNFNERLEYLRSLQERKSEVIRLIDEQGKLTEELRANIDAATVISRVEDLYKPFKKKRVTRASKARDAGLEPLATIILEQAIKAGKPLEIAKAHINKEAGFDNAEKALKGALDIVAEIIADDADNTAMLREYTRRTGQIITEAVNKNEKTAYDAYYNFSEAAEKIPNHRILAVNRGEKEDKIKVKVLVDEEKAIYLLERRVIKGESIFADIIKETISDAYTRLIEPTIVREVRNELKERAEKDAIKVFAKNTENLLMQRPLRNARIIAIDPGLRTGCKVAVLDEYGKLLDATTIFPTPPKCDTEGSKRILLKLVKEHKTNVIVVGNGTASRETEMFVSDFIESLRLPIQYTIVNEAGASVYSASKEATREYPDLDVSTRGAMSLGRRLQDPLSELVKIPVKSIGVGQYQHDINQTDLENALNAVVENAVNRVGVDLNTAGASLLSYVAGIGPSLAKSIVSYREENGAFRDRAELKKVPKLGEKAFAQSAGFLRILNGINPMDGTGIHPESYKVAEDILKYLGISANQISNGGIKDIKKRVSNIKTLAEQLNCGELTLQDILSDLEKPGRDPRDGAPGVVLSKAVKTFRDLKIGMELMGTVRNVVDFGVFVDIGVKNSGLLHISKMSRAYIKHPSDMLAVGDVVKVWVEDLDAIREKTQLTMIPNNLYE